MVLKMVTIKIPEHLLSLIRYAVKKRRDEVNETAVANQCLFHSSATRGVAEGSASLVRQYDRVLDIINKRIGN